MSESVPSGVGQDEEEYICTSPIHIKPRENANDKNTVELIALNIHTTMLVFEYLG